MNANFKNEHGFINNLGNENDFELRFGPDLF